MAISRRKFLGSTSMTLVGLAFTNSLLGQSLSPLIVIPVTETILEKLKRAADIRKNNAAGASQGIMARSATNHPDLSDARAIYDEIIILEVNEVRAYDGIRKILLQEKFMELEVLQLYLANLGESTTNPIFAGRAANEYMRLALGNKKFTEELNSTEDLLVVASTLFNQARIADPANEDYEIQFQKAEQRIVMQSTTLDARDNPALKILRKANRLRYKNRFDSWDLSTIQIVLSEMQGKRKNANRDNHIRELHKVYINRLVSLSDYDKASSELEKLYRFDKTDVHTLKIAREICNKYGRYAPLELIERDNDLTKKTFYSKIALFDVKFKRLEKDNFGSASELQAILLSCENLIRSFGHKFEFNTRKVKLAFLQNNVISSYNYLMTLADSISGITSAHTIDRFNVLCINYFKRSNNMPHAIMVVNIALKQNGLPVENNALLQKIELVNSTRKAEKPIHNQRLNHIRTQLF